LYFRFGLYFKIRLPKIPKSKGIKAEKQPLFWLFFNKLKRFVEKKKIDQINYPI